jgi:tungstate transport system ATP-binding protein
MPEAAVIRLVQAGSPPAVGFEAVTLARAGRTLLDGLSFAVAPSGITALMGPNGAGKSLTLRVMAGLIEPDAGHVRFAGGRPSPRELAFVFQKPVLLRRSVRANLDHAFATYRVPRRARPARIDELLRLTDLAGLGDAPARRLSGGEQQRLAMARALAAGPRFLLLDEPTASLDPHATAAIEALIRRAAADGVKVVLVTHDRGQAARLAEDVLFLHRGRLAEAAPARRFFGAPASPAARSYLKGELLI